jgi:hypothetical protein
MRKLLFIAFIALSINAIGQQKIEVYTDKSVILLNEEISLRSQFLDSVFYQGKVYFINGKSTSALLNYNLLENGITFVDNNKNVLMLDGLEQISFVSYNRRIFFPYQGSFLEQIDSYKNDATLLLKRTTVIKKNTPTGAYGMNTESANIGKYSSLSGMGVLPGYNDLNKEIKVEITLESGYFLKRNGQISSIKRIKDLKKLFPDKKDNILSFISDNKLDVNKLRDLKRIVKYCAEE